MNWIKGLIAKLIGKNIKTTVDGELEKFHISKAKVAFILSGIVTAAPIVAPVFGYTIPPEYLAVSYKLLMGAGLWAMRDALPPTPTPLP